MKNYHTLKSIKATFSINNYMKKILMMRL